MISSRCPPFPVGHRPRSLVAAEMDVIGVGSGLRPRPDTQVTRQDECRQARHRRERLCKDGRRGRRGKRFLCSPFAQLKKVRFDRGDDGERQIRSARPNGAPGWRGCCSLSSSSAPSPSSPPVTRSRRGRACRRLTVRTPGARTARRSPITIATAASRAGSTSWSCCFRS